MLVMVNVDVGVTKALDSAPRPAEKQADEYSWSRLGTFSPPPLLPTSAANRLIGEDVQSRRRPLLGPSPG